MEKKKFKRGFTLGKFMPPHAGHLRLIAEARKHVDHLTVLVCSVQREPIPGKLRFEWMKELIDDQQVSLVHVADEVPSYPHEHPDFWSIWIRLFTKYLPPGIEVFFCGESYGADVGMALGIDHVCIDRSLEPEMITATAIREKPLQHWDQILPPVRPYFVKKVVLTGPESTGKTTMSQLLAKHFQTNWVAEYGREHFEMVLGKLTLADISFIAKTQIEREDKAAKDSSRILFCDTDPIVTRVWSEIYFKDCPSWIVEETEKRKYELFLLLDIDVPWVDDGTREFPNLREFHFKRLKTVLEENGKSYRVISGSYEERLKTAISLVEELLF